MKITICGSMQHEPSMARVAAELEKLGFETEKPNVVEGHVYEDNLDANARLKKGFIDEHFEKIDRSDAIIVVNEDKNGIKNYIGGNTLIEIAYAYSYGLDIFILNPVPDMGYAVEINGMHPIVLDGKLEQIVEYYDSLPRVYASTESNLKHRAISRAFRKVGKPVSILGASTESGVNEQPRSIDESYTGANNRHDKLVDTITAKPGDFFVSIESGIAQMHKKHSYFGCCVVIIQPAGEERRIGIDVDIEFPEAMVSRVPSEYSDFGKLVQAEYGIKEKDPYVYLTNGRLTRQKVLEGAVYGVLSQI